MSQFPGSVHVRVCPYCGVKSQFHIHHQIADTNALSVPKDETSKRHLNRSAMFYCTNCACTLFVRAWGDKLEQMEIFPSKVPDIPAELPPVVQNVFREALLCHGIRAWNATAVMCRRAVQEVAVLHKATGKTLFEQIEFLAQNQTIAGDLRDWAHEVRLIGKDGAHADVPNDVSEQDADEAVEFTTQFMNYIYVLKLRLQSRKNRQQPVP